MQILKIIAKGYIYFELNDYHSLTLHTSGIDTLIEEINSEFIRESFQVRLGIIMSTVSLYTNQIVKTRDYSSLVINQELYEHKKSIAYYYMGYSYIFLSYDQAMKYLDLALEQFKKYGLQSNAKTTTYTIQFVKSFWKIEHEFALELDNYKAVINHVFYLIQKDDKLKAQEVLDQIEFCSLPDWEKGFYYYYQGLISNDKDSFYDSVEWFKKLGDSFHLFLPLNELRKLNENERVLNLLAI